MEEARKGYMDWGVRSEDCSHSLLQCSAGNSWCHAWEFHPQSSFTPTLPSCAEVHIRTPRWCRARYAKPGNVPNAWLDVLHYICPTSPLRHLCALAAEKQVVPRCCEPPAFCGLISTDRRHIFTPALGRPKADEAKAWRCKIYTRSCPCSNRNWRQIHTTVKDGNLSFMDSLRARAINQN